MANSQTEIQINKHLFILGIATKGAPVNGNAKECFFASRFESEPFLLLWLVGFWCV